MPAMLPRLKPDPLPPVTAVPEYLAEGDLRSDYDDTKRVLQVPWMGVVAMAFASYRNLYRAFWPAFRGSFAGSELVEISARLRAGVEQAVVSLDPPPIVPRLKALGYAPREIDQIRDMIEVFSHGNFPYAQMATIVRLLLEGHELENGAPPQSFSGRHAPEISVPFVLVEAHHVDQPTRELYDDIKTRLGLPFVNTDYRALARWPSYFSLAWGDLKGHVQTEPYEGIVSSLHADLVEACLELPNPSGLTAQALRSAAEKDASTAEVLEVVQLFHWLLPGLAANVAFFRAQFDA